MSVIDNLCQSHTVCFCHRQSMSVTDSWCMYLSLTVCVFPTEFVFVTDSLCLSQIVCVCHRIFFVSQSVSISKTPGNHPWPDFYLFIRDFHQKLFVRFQFVRDFNPINPHFCTPAECECILTEILVLTCQVKFTLTAAPSTPSPEGGCRMSWWSSDRTKIKCKCDSEKVVRQHTMAFLVSYRTHMDKIK